MLKLFYSKKISESAAAAAAALSSLFANESSTTGAGRLHPEEAMEILNCMAKNHECIVHIIAGLLKNSGSLVASDRHECSLEDNVFGRLMHQLLLVRKKIQKVSEFRDSGIPEFWNARIPGFRDLKIPGF